MMNILLTLKQEEQSTSIGQHYATILLKQFLEIHNLMSSNLNFSARKPDFKKKDVTLRDTLPIIYMDLQLKCTRA